MKNILFLLLLSLAVSLLNCDKHESFPETFLEKYNSKFWENKNPDSNDVALDYVGFRNGSLFIEAINIESNKIGCMKIKEGEKNL